MKLSAKAPLQIVNAEQITARCPKCGKVSILESIQQDVMLADGMACGQRRCPDPSCHNHVFVVLGKDRNLVAAYPPVGIDFDSSNIPEKIIRVFEEALDCEAAGYHTASAIMIRRTLEEICKDKNAEGRDLKARIKSFSSKVILPVELLEGMDELRILGNDAAHVDAEAYTTLSGDELRIAIEFTKEILKALFQYSALLERLRSLKKTD